MASTGWQRGRHDDGTAGANGMFSSHIFSSTNYLYNDGTAQRTNRDTMNDGRWRVAQMTMIHVVWAHCKFLSSFFPLYHTNLWFHTFLKCLVSQIVSSPPWQHKWQQRWPKQWWRVRAAAQVAQRQLLSFGAGMFSLITYFCNLLSILSILGSITSLLTRAPGSIPRRRLVVGCYQELVTATCRWRSNQTCQIHIHFCL